MKIPKWPTIYEKVFHIISHQKNAVSYHYTHKYLFVIVFIKKYSNRVHALHLIVVSQVSLNLEYSCFLVIALMN